MTLPHPTHEELAEWRRECLASRDGGQSGTPLRVLRLISALEEAQKKVEDLAFLLEVGARCSFCGERMLQEEAAEHMRKCEKHPLSAAREREGRLREALQDALRESESLAYLDPASRLVCEPEIRAALAPGREEEG
jgi:hypothetical protein